MELSFHLILLLLGIVFVAGFVDSIAGGGGLLTLPAYLLFGLPPENALATNKFVNCAGSGIAVINFIKKKKYIKEFVVVGIIASLIGAYLGTKSVLLFDSAITGKIITCMLPVGMISILIPKKKNIEEIKISRSDIYIKTPLICFIFGFYDGFFGPGTGSFLAISFFTFLKIDLIRSTGNAKIFNFTSNLSSLIAFIIAGKVLYLIALPLMGASMLGNYIGSSTAIKKGHGFIKFFLTGVIILLFIIFIGKYII